VIVDLITGKSRRDDCRSRAKPPILHREETIGYGPTKDAREELQHASSAG